MRIIAKITPRSVVAIKNIDHTLNGGAPKKTLCNRQNLTKPNHSLIGDLNITLD